MGISLNNKTALVTGGTRGIGAAISKRLVEIGANVIITGTKSNFKAPNGYRYIAVDFTDNYSTNKFIDTVEDLEIDILINNAGINKIAPVVELNQEEFLLVQKVNVIAPFLLCQAVIPSMR